jgi:hypothetical protein
MTRRILTAREQHAMLSPWRQAAQEEPKKIYRGVRLTNLPPELHQKINDLQQLPMDESEVGQHLHIGPMLLDHLHNTPWKPFAQTPDHLQYTGLGRHWSRRKEFAQLAASNQVGPGLSVVLEADDPGEHHHDPDRPMTGPYGPDDPTEQENTLLPNTPLNITSIRLPGKPFEEVLDDPYYHNMEQEYGHPYPGGPRPGVGGISTDPFAKKALRQTTASTVDGDYAHIPRDENGRLLLWRGVDGGGAHITYVNQPDPEQPNGNPFHFRPPESWDEVERNHDIEDWKNYGSWWGDEGEAKFYGGDNKHNTNDASTHGAMAVQAWFPREHIDDTPWDHDGILVKPGTQGEIAQAHVYHRGKGWLPLHDAPKRTVTAHHHLPWWVQ